MEFELIANQFAKDCKTHKENMEPLVANKVKQLQDINKSLLTEYVIKVGNITIEPLWVEAYYFSNDFPDIYCHRHNDQKNNLEKFYFHQKGENGDQRSGVDLCLSNGEYYYSVLLKCCLVDGEFKTQSELHTSKLKTEYNTYGLKLIKKDRQYIVTHYKRIGLNDQNGDLFDFKNCKLASFCYEQVKMYFKDKINFPYKTEIVKKILKERFTNQSRKIWEEVSKELLGYHMTTYFDEHFNK